MKKKFILLILVIIAGCGIYAAEETVLAKPGAILSLYAADPRNMDTLRPDAGSEPLAVVVDYGKQFCHDNMTLINAIKKYRQQYLFKVWTGYITVNADGDYVFSMAYDAYNQYSFSSNFTHTILEISGKELIYISKMQNRARLFRPQLSSVAKVSLKKGSYELKIIHRSNHEMDRFTLKIRAKQKQLPKDYIIVPDVMVHVE